MLRGALSFLAGLRLLLGREELRVVLWRMLLVQFLVGILTGAGAWFLFDWLISTYMPQADAWYWRALGWVVWVFAWFFSFAVAVVGFVVLGSVAVSPWLETISKRVEDLGGRGAEDHPEPWWSTVLASMRNALMPLLNFLPWAVLALVLLLVPVLGTLAASIIWGYAGLQLLSFEFMDVPASRRGWKWMDRKASFKEHKWFFIGFSGLASILMVLPIVNLLVLPAAVAGLSRDDVMKKCEVM